MFKNIFVFFLISLFSTFNSSYALHYFNNNVTFNQNYIDEYLKFVDYSTHYTGHYGDNKQTMYITGISGGGEPYFILGGFTSNMLDKTVKVTCDNEDFGFTEQDFTVEDYYGDGDLYDIEEKEFYGHVYGFEMRTTKVNAGTYNFVVSYGNFTYKIKVIVEYTN